MKKKLKTSKILSAFIAFTIILLSLPVGIITPLGQRNNVVKASGVGPFKNVMHSLSVTTEMDEDGFYTKCKRDIAGQVEFDWPEPSTYVDFIIIQDTSASFSGQIEEIKTALTGIVKSLNMGVDIDGVSPKDRVMGVSFHGSDGYAITNSSSPTPQTTFYSADNDHLILPTGLMTDQAEVIEAINELTLSGGTPTVDGLAVARENYNAAISTGEFYNNSTYQVEGHERQRRTVYMLITDGIANNTMEKSFLIKPPVERYGDYSNQPGFSPDLSFNWRDNAKMPRFMQAMWAKYTNESTVNEYAIYLPYRPDFSPSSWYKIYNPNIFPNKIGFYLVDQYGYENPTPAYPSFREDVDLQTANLVAYANLMKQEGFGTETNPTEFITAFWENEAVFKNDFDHGPLYETESQPIVTHALKTMAESEKFGEDLYIHETSDINAFTKKLTAAFRKVNTVVVDNVTINLEEGYKAGNQDNLKLERKLENGEFVEVSLPNATTVEDSKIYIAMEYDETDQPTAEPGQPIPDPIIMEPGTYRISYQVTETAFHKEEKQPATLAMSFEGQDFTFDAAEFRPVVPANNRTDCEFNVEKEVSSETSTERGIEKYLKQVTEGFTFYNTYKLNRGVQDVKEDEIIILEDVLEADILYIAESAVAKLIDPETGEETGDTYEVSYDAEAHKLVVTLPANPANGYPYGGYQDMEVEVSFDGKLDPEKMTETHLQELIALGEDNQPIGVPNESTIRYGKDNSWKTITSNKVKVVPPVTKEPTPDKKVEKKDLHNLATLTETFDYEVKAIIPEDVNGYETLVIKDTLAKVLQRVGDVSVRVVSYNESGEETSSTPLVQGTDYTLSDTTNTDPTASEDGVISVSFGATFDYDRVAGKTIVVEFTGKIKAGVTASQLAAYKTSTTTESSIEIPNTVELIFNDNPAGDKTVHVVPPTPETPTPVKSVKEGDMAYVADHVDLSGFDAVSNFKVEVPVDRTDTWETFVLTDPVDQDLEVSNILVELIGGEGEPVSYDINSEEVSFDAATNTITFTLSGAEAISALAGKTVVLTFDGTIIDKATYLANHPDATAENTATLTVDNEAKPSNTVSITPPGEVPEPVKYVKEGDMAYVEDHVDLSAVDAVFNYKVEVPVDRVDGWTDFVLEDAVDSTLTISNVKLELLDGSTVEKTYTPDVPEDADEFSVVNNKITFKLVGAEKLAQLADRLAVLTFDATITDMAAFMTAHPDAIVGNTADLIVDNNPKTSNEVTVTPPGEVPDPVKSVKEDDMDYVEDHVDLSGFDAVANFKVEVPVQNVTGWELFVLTDPVDQDLEVSNILVQLIGGEGDPVSYDINSDEVSFDAATNTITFTLSGAEAISALAGKTVVLTFDGTIKDKATYLENHPDATAENTATLTVDNEAKPSNTVSITPPGDTPKPEKSVKEGNQPYERDHLDLSAVDSVFSYKIRVPVGRVDGWTNFVIEDAVDSTLTISNVKLVLKTGNTVEKTYTPDAPEDADEFSVVNNKITFKLVGAEKLTQLVDRAAVLTYDATITDIDAFIAAHPDAILGNTADLIVDNNPKTSNEVTITPPGEVPDPVKSVKEGDMAYVEDHVDLSGFDAVSNFKVEVPVDRTDTWETFVLTDPVDQDLEVSNILVQITGGEGEPVSYDINSDEVSFDAATNTITFTLSGADAISALAGKTVVLTFDGTIKDKATYLANHPDATAENTATLTVDNEAKPSNTVSITPPGEVPDPVKSVKEGDMDYVEDHVDLSGFDAVSNFKVEVPVQNVTGWESFVLTDPVDQDLEVSNILVQLIGGEGDPVSYDITSDEVSFDAATNTITFTLSGVEAISALAGKTVVLTFDGTIKDKATYLENHPDATAENTATLTVDNEAKPSNTVSITPPGDTPKPEKSVKEGNQPYERDHLDLSAVDSVFSYKIRVPVGRVDGWTNFVIEDAVDTTLTISNVKLELKSGSTVEKTYTPDALEDADEFSVVNNKITFKLVGAEKLAQLADRAAVLTYDATITDIDAFIAAHPDAILGNTADLIVDNNPKTSNEVTITPPGEVPDPVKSVKEGDMAYVEDHVDLSAVDAVFNYKVEVPVDRVDGWTDFVLEDAVDSTLTISNVKLELLDGSTVEKTYTPDVPEDADEFSVVNNKITFKLVGAEKLAQLADRAVVLTFDATITDMAAFIAAHPDAIVGNTADLIVDNNPKTSNEVTVTPPGEVPEPVKYVKEGDMDYIKGHVDLSGFDAVANFKVEVPVDRTDTWETFVLTDPVDQDLEVSNILVQITGGEGDPVSYDINSEEVSFDAATNTITFTLSGANAMGILAGKTVVLTFDGTIIDKATYLENHPDATAENTATLTVDNEAKPSNTVSITPPGEVPDPVKYVKEGDMAYVEDHVDLSAVDAVFNYKVEVPVDRVDGWTDFVLEDAVDSTLTISNVKLELKSGTTVDKTYTPDVPEDADEFSVVNNKITFKLVGAEKLAQLTDRVAVLTFDATITDMAAFIAAHPDAILGNTADLIVDNNPKTSNEVTVTPPGEVPDPVKYVKEGDMDYIKGHVDLSGFDAVANFKVEVPVDRTDTWETFVLTDPVDQDLEVSNILVQLIGGEGDPVSYDINSDEVSFDAATNTITFTLSGANAMGILAGKTVVLTFDGTIIDKASYLENHPDATAENTATLTVDNEAKPSNTVSITPPGDIPKPEKTVKEGDMAYVKPHVDLSAFNAIFDYKVEVPVDRVDGWTDFVLEDPVDTTLTVSDIKVEIKDGDTVEKTYTPDALEDADEFGIDNNNKITFKLTGSDRVAQLSGKTVVLTFSATITDKAAYLEAHPDAIVDNTATLVVGNKSIDSNTVTVVPPGDAPEPVKSVKEGDMDYVEDHVDLSALDAIFDYKVEVDVDRTDGWTEFLLEDPVDALVDVSDIKVEVKSGDSVEATYTPAVPGAADEIRLDGTNKIIFRLTGEEKVQSLSGKTVVLTFTATIRDKATFVLTRPDLLVENTADLKIDNQAKVSNTVTVKPPVPEDPVPVKSVDGDTQLAADSTPLKLGSKDQPFTYDVTVDITANAEHYRSFEIKDTLEDVLETSLDDVTVYLNDVAMADLKQYVSVNGQTVTLKIDNRELADDFDFSRLTGQTLRLEMKSRFKANLTAADLAPYLTEGIVVVPNEAILKINNKSQTTNEVNVTPPGDEPTINKTVENSTSGPTTDLLLNEKDERFKYKVNVAVPADVSNYQNITVTDTLEDVLTTNHSLINVKVTPEPADPSYPSYKDYLSNLTVDGETVELVIDDGFAHFAGKTITLEIDAQIRSNVSAADIAAHYVASAVPNKATLYFNDEPKDSNEVKVTPPSDVPTPKKAVGKDLYTMGEDLFLDSLDQVYYYEITVPVYNNSGMTSFVIRDTVNDLVSIIPDSGQVNGISGVTGSIQITGRTIIYTASEEDIAQMNGSVSLIFKARLNEGITTDELTAALSANARGIPNTAQLQVNSEPDVSTNTVYVKPGLGSVRLIKTINKGKTLPKTETATFELYRLNGRKRSLVGEYTTVQGIIDVTGLELGTYVWHETRAPEGYALAKDVEFTLTAKQPHVTVPVDNRPYKWWMPRTGEDMDKLMVGMAMLALVGVVIALRKLIKGLQDDKA